MKTIFTSLKVTALLLLGTVAAFAGTDEKKVSTISTYSWYEGIDKPDAPSTVEENYYDADGNLVLYFNKNSYSITKTLYTYTDGLLTNTLSYTWDEDEKVWAYSGRYTYTYNESGLLLTSLYAYWDSYTTNDWYESSLDVYSYDEDGNLVQLKSGAADGSYMYSRTVYKNYTDGYYADMYNLSGDSLTVYYHGEYEYTFTDGLLESTIVYSEADAVSTPVSKTEYTYTNGQVSKEVFLYANADGSAFDDVSYIKDYTYDTDGDIENLRDTSYYYGSAYFTDLEYAYGMYNADYAPSNLTVTENTANDAPANTVTLSWTAATSSAVTGYQIICDTLTDIVVTGTSYTTTSSVFNGEHTFYVVSIVDGSLANISNAASITVEDEGIMPLDGIEIIYISERKDDSSYDVMVGWDAPETTSEIEKYVIYASDPYGWYYSFGETTATLDTINLSSYYCIAETGEGDEYGVEVNIYIVPVYTTGLAANSDTVTCTPFDGSLDYRFFEATDLALVSTEKNTTDETYEVTVAWEAPEGAAFSSYEVYYTATDSVVVTDTFAVLAIPVALAEADDNGTTVGVDFDVYVKVVYNDTTEVSSEILTVNPYNEVGGSNAVSLTDATEIKVYPNPASDRIYFSETVNVNIYSTAGQLVLSANEVSDLSLAACKQGLYFVYTETAAGVSAISKLVIE